MDRRELIQAYQKEIAYQTKMLKNIQSWSRFVLLLSTVDVVLIYYFTSVSWLNYSLIFLIICKVIILLVLGKVFYRGSKNLAKVKQDMEDKLNLLK